LELPPAPQAPWQAPTELVPAPEPATPETLEIPPQILSGEVPVTLAQVVSVALANSPRTRETWLAARAAAAEVGKQKAAYWPSLDLTGELNRVKVAAVGGRFAFQQTTYGPTLDVSWLLFDFGGRSADVEDAWQSLLAADFAHNAALQEEVLQVEQAYYQYQTARAFRAAAAADLAGAEANLKAAEARHDAGLATIAEVLQARTAMARARLGLETFEGQMKATQGGLATAMGLPTNVAVEVGELPAGLPLDRATAEVEEILQQAIEQRPDLLAARATAAAADAQAASAGRDRLPSIEMRGSTDRTYYWNQGVDPADNYSLSLLLRYPLFNGFQRRWELAEKRREAEAAHARTASLEQLVALQVWTSYYDLQTAAQRVETSRELLASARQSADVAAGRYKAGVGSILDLLTAQSALAEARAEEVAARADWLLAAAQLAHDSGALGPPPAEAEGVAVPADAAPSTTPAGSPSGAAGDEETLR
jgi:outer membrane protein TolC